MRKQSHMRQDEQEGAAVFYAEFGATSLQGSAKGALEDGVTTASSSLGSVFGRLEMAGLW